MSRLVSSVRSTVAKARANPVYGRLIPSNKVLAGALAAEIVVVAHQLGVGIPVGWPAAIAAMVVGYFVPDATA